MATRASSVAAVGVFVLFVLVPTAAAQSSNVETIEGPTTGERTTLTISPHSLTDDVSARALGVSASDSTRWAITLIGTTAEDSLGLSVSGNPLPIERVTRPDEGEIGPTRLYVSRKTFRAIAKSGGVEIHIGDTSTAFPEQMRRDMRQIYDTVK